MIKIVVMKKYYALCEKLTEEQILDRFSFTHFLGVEALFADLGVQVWQMGADRISLVGIIRGARDIGLGNLVLQPASTGTNQPAGGMVMESERAVVEVSRKHRIFRDLIDPRTCHDLTPSLRLE